MTFHNLSLSSSESCFHLQLPTVNHILTTVKTINPIPYHFKRMITESQTPTNIL